MHKDTCSKKFKFVCIEREIGSFKEKALWTSILKVCFSFFLSGAFGCAAGAFSYSTLTNRKNFEADALNPNLYSSLENLKDNRKMENLYDELSKKAIASATVPRRGKFIIIKCNKYIIYIFKSHNTLFWLFWKLSYVFFQYWQWLR